MKRDNFYFSQEIVPGCPLILVAIFSSSYNVEAAIEAVKTSLMVASKEMTSLNERKSREASPHQNRKEKKRQSPATKKKDPGKVRDMSPVINKKDLAKARDMSPVVNKKDSGKARSSSPVTNKKNTANAVVVTPEVQTSTSSQGTSGERSHIIDLTDGSEGPFQSLSGTSYAECRAEAQVHAAIRKDWLRKAAKAYTDKQGHVASYCADEVSDFIFSSGVMLISLHTDLGRIPLGIGSLRSLLKTAGFAEKNFSYQKNGNGMLKNENSNVVVRPSELKPLQCNVLLLCQSQEKRICEVSLFFSNIFENFHSRNNALCDLSKVCQLQEQKVSEASDLYRF